MLEIIPKLSHMVDQNPSIIEIRDLVKEYPSGFLGRPVQALGGVNLDLAAGKTLALIGPNGAGKSTLIETIVGLRRPTSGTVRVFGESPQTPAIRRRMGYMPENPQFYPELTGRENLELVARLLDGNRLIPKVNDELERVNLSEAADRLVTTYSKGMTQRLCIAQALIGDPDLLLLDEPFSGLDPEARALFMSILTHERTQGRTIVISTHEVDRLDPISDVIAILISGTIQLAGEIQSLLTDVHPYHLEMEGIERSAVEEFGDVITEEGMCIGLQLPDETAMARALDVVVNAGGRVQNVSREPLLALYRKARDGGKG